MKRGNREIDAADRRPARDRIAVLHDDRCPFCRDTARNLKRLDWLDRLELVGLHPWDRVRERMGERLRGIDPQRAREQLHVVLPDGRVEAGYAAFRALSRHLPLLWPVAPLLHLPGAERIGQRLYLLIARNRHRFTSS
ncbi:MAG: DUF393 domain-containing protein [Candidatus Eisenbacteria bacterium]|nr:DUF393 domain-containing protein [Candidatus Latescibacterota bacterium]MBD3301076.1 DUF393 domain-containing protein [Candidatus Eisenbacteria bacterium]